MKAKNEQYRFGFLDVARVFAGILLFNAVASWWFTSSATWGYTGKWVDGRFIKYQLFGQHANFTSQELSLYNGSDPNLPIYIGIYGRVYDVTASRHIYGPKGPYSFFSGKDAARAFVTGCFQNQEEFTHDLRGLNPVEARADIKGWQDYYDGSHKYWLVGNVIHEPLTGEPPEPCEHRKFPH
ncbi:Cytochrome b5-like Heme/Steroid binding domain-containing protein [Metschnikowia aff. pulcherrima]|uniref:Cytochrome b5-like Heme/Steroid binding domain-containing protein n=1 Tax=Metschnikowia aff. pulcherrima TaxID=2163413 RepID=A0A4V1AED5_9ASCO|nr:Cytochrome b5-like Heme/Steroid binding domain-containing protein [Metschnikowia aff. pulcherrima]